MFSACPVGMEVQRSIPQIAPNNAFRLGPKSPGECFGKGAGGEGGIRTHDTVSRIHAFQASAFSHSATSPDTPGAI